MTRLVDLLAAVPPGADVAVVRRGADWVIGVEPDRIVTGGLEALGALESGWWAGFCSYDLGRQVERVRPRLVRGPNPPAVLFGRFDARLVLGPGGVRVEGAGPGRRWLEALARRRSGRPPAPVPLREWRSDTEQGEYESAVATVLELIRAGECYQVNLARRLSSPRPADAVALFAALVTNHPAPHAALVRFGEVAVVSASPERFLLRDGPCIRTRPMKGTAADAAVLTASEKDRAENVMIVDLARNDLGRVCRYGTITVPGLCQVEAHPGLHHLVSTVDGTLRDGVTTTELLAATFPPASVTGAPKPRVLQAIEDLEPTPRGAYCGAVGFVDGDRQSLDLNVAIRTFEVAGGVTSLGVGAGIVADSDPRAEWRETELKAARLLAVAGAEPSAAEALALCRTPCG